MSDRTRPDGRREAPWARDAEESMIGALLLGLSGADRGRALREVGAEDFWDPSLRSIFSAIEALHAAGEPVDPVTVSARLAEDAPQASATKDRLVELAANTPASAHFRGYGDLIRKAARARAAITVGDELVTAGYEEDLERVEKLVGEIETRAGSRAETVETDDLADLWALDLAERENPTKPWVIPGCLRAGEVYILTGSEGGGKMMYLRQTGASVAAGVHPFTGLSQQMERRRVLALDLQEDRVDQAAELGKLRDALGREYEPGWYRSVSWPAGVDLLSPRGRRRVEGAIEDARPDLVVLGPLVKAFRAPAGTSRYGEDVVDEVTAVLDEMMDRYSFGLMIEAHAGNTRGNDDDWRVRGSSVWRSWPAFSHGLKVVSTDPREAEVVRARPDRYDDRAWPTRLYANPARRFPWSVSEGDYEKVLRAMGLGWLVDGAAQESIPIGDEPF